MFHLYKRRDWLEYCPPGFLTLTGKKLEPKQKRSVFIHHTAFGDRIMSSEQFIGDFMPRLGAARPDLKETDVPYNYVCSLDGKGMLWVAEGQGSLHRAEAVRGRNTEALSIAFSGNWEDCDEQLPDLAKEDLACFLLGLRDGDYGSALFNLGSDQLPSARGVYFHREVQATHCPGRMLVESLKDFRWADGPQSENWEERMFESWWTEGKYGEVSAALKQAMRKAWKSGWESAKRLNFRSTS